MEWNKKMHRKSRDSQCKFNSRKQISTIFGEDTDKTKEDEWDTSAKVLIRRHRKPGKERFIRSQD
eukprot:4205322-Amphidinium_carterae.1